MTRRCNWWQMERLTQSAPIWIIWTECRALIPPSLQRITRRFCIFFLSFFLSLPLSVSLSLASGWKKNQFAKSTNKSHEILWGFRLGLEWIKMLPRWRNGRRDPMKVYPERENLTAGENKSNFLPTLRREIAIFFRRNFEGYALQRSVYSMFLN